MRLSQQNGAITINWTVILPVKRLSTTVPLATLILVPVETTNMNPNHNLVGFQGDFTFDSSRITFDSTTPVLPAGLTANSWNVSGNIIGTATVKVLRISAFSTNFTPLNGCGVLFNLNMRRVSATNNANTALTWQPTPDNLFFIAADLSTHPPFATPPGLITITTSANPTPTPIAVPACTPKTVVATQLVLDHFKAYVTSGPVNGDQVQLRDQFDPPDDPDVTPTPLPFRTVGAPVRFGVPVQKTVLPPNCPPNDPSCVTPVTNPDAHMEMFQLLPPEAGITRYVDVVNQFGAFTLTTQDSVLLGVPTQKLPFGAPPSDPNSGPFLDHYKFYSATGPAVGFTVNLVDQFHRSRTFQ